MRKFSGIASLISVAALLISCSEAAGWNFRWRNLNQSVGSTCSSSLKPGLNSHVNEALIDILMYLWQGEINATVPEVCDSNLQLSNSAFMEANINNVCLNLHSGNEARFVQSYYSLMNIDSQMKAISAIPALKNYQDSSGAAMRGYVDQSYAPILTSGPSQSELADAVYRLAVQRGWSYIAILTEAEVGAMRLSQALQDMARTEHRVCFPLIITFTASNASQAAKSLRDFTYPKMTRLTVVYAGSGNTFMALWNLVTGTDAMYTDSEKRYQFVLAGDAIGSFHKVTDTPRRRHFGLGTIFVFPGILDPRPETDQMSRLLYNITSSPASMGRFSALTGTWSRLVSMLTSTSVTCNWRDFSNACFTQALMYDYQLLSFVPLLTTPFGSPPDLSTTDKFETLRHKSITLTDLRATFSFLDAFVEQNYTSYSLARGLQHKERGFWQPIVKVYQSQLSSGASTLMQLGELRVRQAGTANQIYEWDLSKTPEFYQFTGGSPDSLPIRADSSSSVCPNSCPECVPLSGKQYVQYKPGDIYVGAILPIYNHGTDMYQCSDGTLNSRQSEWLVAFQFVVDLTNWASQDAPSPPPGMDPTLVDQQFLLGLRDLLSKVQKGRTKKLNWGYVILDSCYAATYLTNKLALLMDGKLEPLIGLNYTKFVGFVGDLSSTQTMAASQVLKQYSVPIISHASTSTALSDVFQYPFTMRTVASDNEIIEAMITIIKHYGVDLITVVNTPNAYGLSLRDAMLTRASRERICIAKLLVFNCGFADISCKRSLALNMRNAGTRYVAFLSDGSDLGEFLNFPQVEIDLEFMTIFATEDIDNSLFTGKNNLGVGTTMVQLVSTPDAGFLKFLNYTLSRLPANSNNLSQWDRLYFESVQQCYLTDSFVRSSAYAQPCLASIVESHRVTQLESRSVLLMTAAETLILGSLTAIKYLCSVVTPEPACPAFFNGDGVTQLQRANLIMYGQVTATGTTAQRFSGTYEGTEWSFQKIFENRMGRTPMRLLQFRKIGSAEYGFVQFGLFDGKNSSEFSATAEQLFKLERQVTGAVTACRTRAECNDPKCENAFPTDQTPPCINCGSLLGLLGLLGLLFVPGVCIGVFFYRYAIKKGWFLRNQQDPYHATANPYATGVTNAGMTGSAERTTPINDSCYYDVADVPTIPVDNVHRPLPIPP